MTPPRLLPGRDLPPYTYVPGSETPHPTRDPTGHRYGQNELRVQQWNPQQWQACTTYLWGADLFNFGFYWEAHEQWEAVWHATQAPHWDRDLISALIKLTAAGVKQREGRILGVQRHLARSLRLVESTAAHINARQIHPAVATRPLGLNLPQLHADIARLLQLASRSASVDNLASLLHHDGSPDASSSPPASRLELSESGRPVRVFPLLLVLAEA